MCAQSRRWNHGRRGRCARSIDQRSSKAPRQAGMRLAVPRQNDGIRRSKESVLHSMAHCICIVPSSMPAEAESKRMRPDAKARELPLVVWSWWTGWLSWDHEGGVHARTRAYNYAEPVRRKRKEWVHRSTLDRYGDPFTWSTRLPASVPCFVPCKSACLALADSGSSHQSSPLPCFEAIVVLCSCTMIIISAGEASEPSFG